MTDRFTLIEARHSIRRGDRELILSPRKFAIFARILKAKNGITPQRIFEAEYSDDPNGGPLTGRHNIVAQISQMNRHLAAVGLRIVAHKRGAGAAYEIRREAMP